MPREATEVAAARLMPARPARWISADPAEHLPRCVPAQILSSTVTPSSARPTTAGCATDNAATRPVQPIMRTIVATAILPRSTRSAQDLSGRRNACRVAPQAAPRARVDIHMRSNARRPVARTGTPPGNAFSPETSIAATIRRLAATARSVRRTCSVTWACARRGARPLMASSTANPARSPLLATTTSPARSRLPAATCRRFRAPRSRTHICSAARR